LLVSHDLGLIKRLADRAIFMLEGQVVMEGTPKDAVNQYVGFVLDRERSSRPPKAGPEENVAAKSSFRHGDGVSRIVDVQLLNAAGHQCRTFRPGDAFVVRIQATFNLAVSSPVVGMLIRNRIGVDVFGTNSRLEGIDLGAFEKNDTLQIEFEMDCLLTRQEYTLTVATQYWNGLSQDWMDDVLDFEVVDTKDVAGVLNLNARVRHHKLAGARDSRARLTLP
jgi:lipopolysaccharide transport system ATP-binding protein